MNLGVIMGGMSTEHNVSIVSGTSIIKNLNKEKYNIFELKYGPVLLKNQDKVFKDYLKLNKKKLLKIYNSLGNKYFLKKFKIKQEIKLINKA